jgi:Holliday junction resolvase RusA-like endonuclease
MPGVDGDLVIRFTVPAVPVAQPRQRHRRVTANGRTVVHNYTPARHPVTDFKATVRMVARSAHAGPPLDGPLSLAVVFVLPRPARLRWKKRPMPRCCHPSKPDVVKAVTDALNGLLRRDDSQLADLRVRKWYASGDEPPGIELYLRRLSDLRG